MHGNLLPLVLAALILGGRAAQAPVRSADLERKIEAARTRADHQEIAAIYERRAQADGAAAEQHRALGGGESRARIASSPPA